MATSEDSRELYQSPPGMQIADVSAFWVQIPIDASKQHVSDYGTIQNFDAVIVRVETRNGVVGWGEGKNAAGSAGDYAAMVECIQRELGPRIIGMDARNPLAIWDMLYSGTRYHYARDRGHVFPELGRHGLKIGAMSAIDIALWDITGKSLAAPIWQLLGGMKASKMPAYASGGWADEAGIGDQLNGYISEGGFRAVKMRVGAMDGTVAVSARRVRAAREAIDDSVDLMLDAHGTWTVSEAKRFCQMISDLDIAWLEEPINSDNKRGMRHVRSSTHVPIAAGECEYTRFSFATMVEEDAVDILQPDPAVCGGLSELVRIGNLAACHDLQVAPHLWAGALAFAAGLHFIASSNASFIVEYSLSQNPMLHELTDEGFDVIDGMSSIPQGPGLGRTIREDVVRSFARSRT